MCNYLILILQTALHVLINYINIFVVVYCACSLACHSLPTTFAIAEPKPHFYVNVADIETLESEVTYVACKLL